MRQNKTIYKRMLRTSIISLLLLCAVPCFPVSAAPYETDIVTNYTDDNGLGIEVMASDIGWRYKSVNGVLYKRKYDYTLRKWIGKWIFPLQTLH